MEFVITNQPERFRFPICVGIQGDRSMYLTRLKPQIEIDFITDSPNLTLGVYTRMGKGEYSLKQHLRNIGIHSLQGDNGIMPNIGNRVGIACDSYYGIITKEAGRSNYSIKVYFHSDFLYALHHNK